MRNVGLTCLLSLTVIKLAFWPTAVLAQVLAQSPALPAKPSNSSSNVSSNLSSNLSLSEAFQRADQNNPQLIAARANLPVSLAGITSAGVYPNPQIGLTYGFGKIYSAAGNPQQVQISQTIELGGKRSARMGVAKTQYELALAQLESQRFAIRDQVRRAYAELAAAEGYARALQEQTTLVQKLLEIARKRFEAGAAPEADVLQAKLALMQLDPQQKQAQTRIQVARIQLNTLLGQPQLQPIEVTDKSLFDLNVPKTQLVPAPTTELPPVETFLTLAYQQRPDLRTAEEQLKVANQQLRLVKAQRVPDLQLSGGYLFSHYSHAEDVPASLNAAETGIRSISGAFVGVAVTVPLFYHQQGEAAQATAAIAQASKQVEAQRQQIATDIQTAYQSLITARDNVRKYRNELLPASREVTALAQESYQVGKTGLASAIVAEQADQQVRSGYLDAITAYQSAYADLEKAVGGTIENVH